MHHRYDSANIPTEVLRTFTAVVEAGNFSQAGNLLGLTQSAISAQIRRLEQVVGREVFRRSAAGIHLTEHGKVVLSYARRILAMNDQLLSHSKPHRAPDQIRIGMPRWVPDHKLIEIIESCSAVQGADKVSFRCDSIEHLMRDLTAGQLDLALLCGVAEPPGKMLTEWWEEMYWVKSPRLTLNFNAPLPLVGGPGSMSDRLATKAFTEAGIQYTIAFSATELASRVAAVAAGLGIMIVPERLITRGIEVANDEDLPSLPHTRKGLYIRDALDLRSVEGVARALETCIRPTSSNVITVKIPDRPKMRRRKIQQA